MIENAIDIEAIRFVLAESGAGKLIFPKVVERMLAAGAESYFVDAKRAEHTVYLVDGTTLVEKMDLALDPVAGPFSRAAIVAAIRAAQRDEIRYPEFMSRTAAAGVVGYWAFLTGKKVIYFGAQGDFHEEYFPGVQRAVSSRVEA
jgi:uncharacterized protein YbcV (DUF1398 family)